MRAPWVKLPPLHAPDAEQRRLNHIVWALSTLRTEAAAMTWEWPR
jgi:hypothetical protein